MLIIDKNKIKLKRIELGYTQKEVTDRLGFKVNSMVSYWESGKRKNPNISFAKMIKFYGGKVSDYVLDVEMEE